MGLCVPLLEFNPYAQWAHIRSHLFNILPTVLFGILLPTSRQPRGFSWSASQIEYCSSSLMTTLYIVTKPLLRPPLSCGLHSN